MQTLKQQPVREVRGRYGKLAPDGIYRDTVAPFNCRRIDYLASAKFSNAVKQYGVEPVSITALENGNKVFRLKLRGPVREYEVMLDGGSARLGLVNAPRTTKQLLGEGGASSESTWTKFAEIIRQQEGK